jgi:hypothetical protein
VDGLEGLLQMGARVPAPWRPQVSVAGEFVVQFFESTGALDKAKLWREKLTKYNLPTK